MSDPAADPATPFRKRPALLAWVRQFAWHLRFRAMTFRTPGKVRSGKAFSIGYGADIRSPDFATFGNNVAIGRNFLCDNNLVIGDRVLISSNVSLIGHDHDTSDPVRPVYDAPLMPPATTHIEDEVFIGFGVTILGSVRIGKGCIVGAGSLVTCDLPAGAICVGTPAKFVRWRSADR